MNIDIDYAISLKLAENVYQQTGNKALLLECGTILTEDIIAKLKIQGVKEVYVNVDDLQETFTEQLQEKVTNSILEHDFNAIKKLANTYLKIADSVDIIKHDMSKYVKFKEVTPLILSVLSTNFAVSLTKKYNETFGHNHAIDISKIACAAMLQDIGLTVSDNKPFFNSIHLTYQSDYEHLQIKYPALSPDALKVYDKDFHPLYSYYIVKGNHFDTLVERTLLFHNEVYRIDEMKETSGILNISLATLDDLAATMAMILKAAEIYNRLLFAGKNYNEEKPFALIPKQLDMMVANGVLSPEIVNILKETLPLYPVGSHVMLSDGTIAKVIGTNSHFMLKPKIADRAGNEIEYEQNLEVLYPLSLEQLEERLNV